MPAPTRCRGLTLLDAAFVVGLLAILFAIMTLPGGASRAMPLTTACRAHQSGLYKAMFQYGLNHADVFPVAGERRDAQPLVGFREGSRPATISEFTRPADVGAQPHNNVTASLWWIVRSSNASPDAFVCPSTGDVEDPLNAPLASTFDFRKRKHLSYSPLNMYHPSVTPRWNLEIDASWVILADNNAADRLDERGVRRTDVEELNSPNHAGYGQNVLFGDGHVEWTDTPEVNGDDIYATTASGATDPATLAVDAGDPATRDFALVPLSGNNGVSLSGNVADITSTTTHGPGPTLADQLRMIAPPIACAILVSIYLLKRRPAHGRDGDEDAS